MLGERRAERPIHAPEGREGRHKYRRLPGEGSSGLYLDVLVLWGRGHGGDDLEAQALLAAFRSVGVGSPLPRLTGATAAPFRRHGAGDDGEGVCRTRRSMHFTPSFQLCLYLAPGSACIVLWAPLDGERPARTTTHVYRDAKMAQAADISFVWCSRGSFPNPGARGQVLLVLARDADDAGLPELGPPTLY